MFGYEPQSEYGWYRRKTYHIIVNRLLVCFSRFEKKFQIPDSLDADKAEARFKVGILKVGPTANAQWLNFELFRLFLRQIVIPKKPIRRREVWEDVESVPVRPVHRTRYSNIVACNLASIFHHFVCSCVDLA